MSGHPAQPATTRLSARAGLGLFFAAILLVFVTLVLWPAIDRARFSTGSYPRVVNQTADPIVIHAIDTAGGEVHKALIPPGETRRVVIARGNEKAEFYARTIHVLITDQQGVEIASAAFSGEEVEQIGLIKVENTVRYFAQDNKSELGPSSKARPAVISGPGNKP